MVSQKRNVIYEGQEQIRYKERPLSNTKQTVILARSVCLHSLKMAPVMRLKGKECILENQTDSVKAEDEIFYI